MLLMNMVCLLLHVYNLKVLIFCCVMNIGIEHKVNFVCCSCEPIGVTLARADLWPASPKNPRLAFTFCLLNWAESLMLECQVSLKDFWNSLKFVCPFSAPRRDIYSALIDSFEEYRYPIKCGYTRIA